MTFRINKEGELFMNCVTRRSGIRQFTPGMKVYHLCRDGRTTVKGSVSRVKRNGIWISKWRMETYPNDEP